MNKRGFLIGGVVAAATAGLTYAQRNPLTRWALTQRENEGLQLTSNAALDAQTCVLTPEQVEGPFFFQSPVRSDIREDREGVKLKLNLHVARAETCVPVDGALIEVWHCDAAGRYSGYPEHLSRRPFETMRFLGGQGTRVEPVNEKLYLRGAQMTSADGTAAFDTILPGWYEPRVPHIHVKVFIEDRSFVTTQLYFAEDLTREVYSTHPSYKPHGLAPYRHSNDVVLGANPDAQGLLLHTEREAEGLTAHCRLAIA